MLAIRVVDCDPDDGDDPGKPSPEMCEDLSDVVSAGAEHGEEGVSDGDFQRAS